MTADDRVADATPTAHRGLMSRALAGLRTGTISDDPLIRRLALAQLVNTVGFGLVIATVAIYYTRFLGFSNHQLSVALAAGAAAAVVATLPAGHLADRVRPRAFLAVGAVVLAVCALAPVFIRSFAGFLALEIVTAVVVAAVSTTSSAFMGRVLERERRMSALSYQRSATNMGVGIGSLLSGIALTIDTAAAFKWLFVIDAVTWLVYGWLRLVLPDLPPAANSATRQRKTEALRDRGYVGLAVVDSVLRLHDMVYRLALPLWLVQFTVAPKATIAIVFALVTAAVTVFQVHLGKGGETPQSAARTLRNCAWFFLIAFAVYASARHVHQPLLAATVIIVGSLIHVYGEMRHVPGAWGLQFGLAKPGFEGQYQAVWRTGQNLSNIVGPPLLALLCLQWREPGWLLLGLLLVGAGAVAPALVNLTAARATRQART
ncbi:MAG: MFS transporter [Actinobacteria bacterium]|nr:MFS transporter [Actinomycetota bacterium]